MSMLLLVLVFEVVAVISVTGQCFTWFKEAEDGTCQCGSNVGGVIKCDEYTETVYIAVGYCMSMENTSDRLLLGYCMTRFYGERYENISHYPAYNALPRDQQNLSLICKSHNTKGLLCGQCEDGYGWAINTVQAECTKCNSVRAAVYAGLLVLLPFTVFFLIVVLFRPNFSSSEILGYILFCQGFSLSFYTANGFYISLSDSMQTTGSVLLATSLWAAGIWWYCVPFFYSVDSVCFSETMTKLQVVSLQYMYNIYPLVLIFVTWLCIELHARGFKPVVYLWKPFRKCCAKISRSNWSSSDSIIHAYATFFLLSFTSLNFVTFGLLFTTNIYDIDGNNVAKRRLLYDPTMESFSSQHLPYAMPAILLLFFFGLCPTLFLCLYPTKLYRRIIVRACSSRAQITLGIFAEAFQSCYKDGLNQTYDYRFLSSAPMFLYLFLTLFCTIFWDDYHGIIVTVAIFSFVNLFSSIVVAFIKPFKTLYLNFSIIFHCLIATLLTAIYVLWFLYEGEVVSGHSLAMVFTILTLLPHILAFVTLLYRIQKSIKCIRKRFEKFSEKISSHFHRSPAEVAESSLPDRVINSFNYRRLPQTA